MCINLSKMNHKYRFVERSAKPLFGGSIPPRASNPIPSSHLHDSSWRDNQPGCSDVSSLHRLPPVPVRSLKLPLILLRRGPVVGVRTKQLGALALVLLKD